MLMFPVNEVNRYICMIGDCPSGGVNMFALFTWLTSGMCRPRNWPETPVSAPSPACATTLSPPSKFRVVQAMSGSSCR